MFVKTRIFLFAYLLPTVRRKVEDQDGKEGYAHARDD